MDESKRISVIVPAYNVEPWLPRCLESILSQTYGNLEILVIDDGSSDKTGEIADIYGRRDARIRVIHQVNAGLIEVRERGILEAKGEYVGFVDGDDEIEPDMYERLLKNALQFKAEISQCGILYCFYDGRKKPVHGTGKLYVMERDEGLTDLLTGSLMEPSLCNKLYLKSLLFESCLDKSLVNNEDLLRNFVLFDRAERSVFEDFCGYHYWRREGSMSNNRQAVRIARNILRVRRLIWKHARESIRAEALNCYVNGLINAYNSMIGKIEAESFRLRCQKELRRLEQKEKALDRKTRIRIWAITRIPFVYDGVYLTHRKQMYKRIAREAREAREGTPLSGEVGINE